MVINHQEDYRLLTYSGTRRRYMAFVIKNNNKRGVYIEVLLILETIVIHQIKPYCCLVDYKHENKKCVPSVFFTLTLHPCTASMTTMREIF